MVRLIFLVSVLVILMSTFVLSFIVSPSIIIWILVVIAPIFFIGFFDMFQKKKAVRRNFPIIGNLRYLMESIRPEINQYFVESSTSGVPFSREDRSVVYQRAKGVRDTIPFGTLKDVYKIGYEWVNHSITPRDLNSKDMRVVVGGSDCVQPYSASILNIGAMSFGALSNSAIRALNKGASIGRFAHNTGEGGISPYHLESNGDLIWQVGTAYFGCRKKNGRFCADQFAEKAKHPNVKMIELKISQGAKPGKGGILPGAKVSAEISQIRGIPEGIIFKSPAAHSEFNTPIELLKFIEHLRLLSGGKPVGFKLCIGKRREFIAICKAMVKTGITPDFITVDGGEGGTGAAPMEFSNYVGTPLTESLIFVHNVLVGFSLRNRMRIIASGKVTTAFGMIHRLCTGADIVYSARGMMMSLGCIQALKCDSNSCPVGVATQDPGLTIGLDVPSKSQRVFSYHKLTVHSLVQIIGAMGLEHTSELKPYHLLRRVSTSGITHYGQIYHFLKDGDLLKSSIPPDFASGMDASSAETFANSLAEE